MIGVLFITVVVVTIVTSWIFLLRSYKSYKNIPGPVPLPVLGNGHLFVGKPTVTLNALSKLRKCYGDAVLIHILHEPIVHISHPKYIEPMLSHNELITKGSQYNVLHDWLGTGLITSAGNHWRRYRKLLTPAFHFNILQNFLPVFLKNEKTLVKNFKGIKPNESINVLPHITLAALDNVTESIMGVSINAQEDSESKYVKAIEEISRIMMKRMINPFLIPDAIFNLTPYKKIQDDALQTLHGQSRNVIETRKKELIEGNIHELPPASEFGFKNKHAFLDLLLLSKVDGRNINEDQIRNEVDTFMFAGHDTTSAGITYTMYCLSKHENIQNKIFEEQIKIFGDDLSRDPTYSELKEMKYLEMVIKESLRLFPPVPLIGRQITEDSDIGGLKIKKNTTVFMNIYEMHRHPDIHADPLEFRPERFDGSNSKSAGPFSWVPFSAGPRNCIGQKFAMMELKVTIAAIVKNFKILPVDMEPDLCADLILRPYNGVEVKLAPRFLNNLG